MDAPTHPGRCSPSPSLPPPANSATLVLTPALARTVLSQKNELSPQKLFASERECARREPKLLNLSPEAAVLASWNESIILLREARSSGETIHRSKSPGLTERQLRLAFTAEIEYLEKEYDPLLRRSNKRDNTGDVAIAAAEAQAAAAVEAAAAEAGADPEDPLVALVRGAAARKAKAEKTDAIVSELDERALRARATADARAMVSRAQAELEALDAQHQRLVALGTAGLPTQIDAGAGAETDSSSSSYHSDDFYQPSPRFVGGGPWNSGGPSRWVWGREAWEINHAEEKVDKARGKQIDERKCASTTTPRPSSPTSMVLALS